MDILEKITKSRPPRKQKFSLWDSLKQHPNYPNLRDSCYFSTSALGLRSPLNLPDIEKAIQYLHSTLERKAEICILGDRDVDGISSTALLGSFLQEKYPNDSNVNLLVSDDGDDYGLSGEMFERVRSCSASLVILLDMGSSHGPEIETLVKEGKQVIVLDHHQLHDRVPDANLCAFVNPQRNKDQHSGHGGKIATVGLVFKLLFAYALSHISDWKRVYLLELSDKWHAFRCGLHLHSFSCQGQTPETKQAAATKAWQVWAQENIQQNDESNWEVAVLRNDSQGSYTFSVREWQDMRQDPDYAARLLLARLIESRPRLKAFVQNMADLGALGTITDIVPLTDENRALVRIGIGRAMYDKKPGKRPYRIGYTSLVEAMRLSQDCITSRDLAWSIGPAINAAGRMGNSKLALKLLLSNQEDQAKALAQDLVKLNERRKQRTKRNEATITQHLSKNPQLLERPFLFCYHPELEPGISGIIASRLSENYQKSVIYINNNGAYARGSARSWGSYNILELLDTASDLFIQFGGHTQAAGFSIAYENIASLEQALLQGYAALLRDKLSQKNKDVSQNSKAAQQEEHAIEIQAYQLDRHLLEEIYLLEPFGAFNPEPVFCLTATQVLNVRYMTQGLHASFRVAGAPISLNFIAWRQGDSIKKAVDQKLSLRLYGCLEKNRFRGWDEFIFRVEKIIPH